MPHKTSMYLDTSVLNALFRPPEDRKETTIRFFEQTLPNYDNYISEFTLVEIRATPDLEQRQQLNKLVKQFQVLSITPQAEELSKVYLKYLKIPEADALHIAIVSVEGINYLITWNMRHIARERTRRIIDNTNFLEGFPRIYIATPDDFLE